MIRINIDDIGTVPREMITKDNLRVINLTGQNITLGKDLRGRLICRYRHGVKTKIGNIEYSEWVKGVRMIIADLQEENIYKKYISIYSNIELVGPAIAKEYECHVLMAYMMNLHHDKRWKFYKEFENIA